MKQIFLMIFLSLLLFPISTGFSQQYDTPPTLSVNLASNSPYIYKDSEGFTIVIGEVENNDDRSSISDVQLSVKFFDDFSPQPLEITTGSTVLEVIPPNQKSPYVIRSSTANPQITSAEVSLEGFSSSVSKTTGLQVEATNITLGENLTFSGNLKNIGGAPTEDIMIYLAFYDAFDPPRIIDVSSISLGMLNADEEITFEFNERIDLRSKKFHLFAESEIFNSNFVDMKIPPPEVLTKQVMISDVYVSDVRGKPLSQIKQGSTVNIQAKSWIQTISNGLDNTPYTFYAQIKQSGEIPYVEFLGNTTGSFEGTEREFPSVTWVPKNKGVFFIETYVWDDVGVPLANPGPVVLVIVT